MTARAALGTMLRQRRELGVLAFWALVGALPTFVTGHALARSLDQGFRDGKPLVGLAWLGALALAVPLGAWGTSRTYLCVARLVEPLRDDLVRTVVDGALRRSADPSSGRDTGAVARLTQHIETVRDNVAGLLLLVAGFVAGLVAALSGLVTLAPIVLPLVLAPLLVSFALFAASLPLVTRQQRRLLLADEALAGLATDTAEGLRDVVACGGEDRVTTALHEAVAEQVAAGRAVARVTAARTVIVAIGGRLPLVLVLLTAGWLLDRGLTPGALFGALTYLIQGLEPAVSSMVGSVGAPVAQLMETLRRIDHALPDQRPVVPPTGRPRDAGLVLQGVTFRYRAAAEPVVHDLDLVIREGEHLAIVGPSGAGKSTLGALMVGMLTPQSGDVRHGGMPALQVVASERVLIPQQAYAFRATLEENLRYLHREASPAALDRAVTAVGMNELVERLGGYSAELEPGTLSAGERQLVALVRAYLSPAALVVLDEATCYLDPTAEAIAEQAFADRGGTLVVVAHRISSAHRADRILVMDGLQTTIGTHDKLVGSCRLYRDLVGHWFADDPGNAWLVQHDLGSSPHANR